MPRSQRNPVSGCDPDVAIQTWPSARCAVVGTVSGPGDRFRALIRRIEECITAAERKTAEPAMHVAFEALPPRFSEILEITETTGGCRDEQDIVRILGAEPAGAPTKLRF